MHVVAGRAFSSTLLLYLGIHLVEGQKPTTRAVDVALYVVMGLAAVVWVLSAEPIRRRRYTAQLRPRGSGWALFIQRPERSSRGKKALKKRAESTSRSILELLAEYRETDPTRDPWWYGQPNWHNMSDEDRTRIFNEHGSKSSAHTTQYMSRYLVEYSAKAMALFEEFKSRDMTEDSHRHWFEHPTNPLGVEEVGRLLGIWAKQL